MYIAVRWIHNSGLQYAYKTTMQYTLHTSSIAYKCGLQPCSNLIRIENSILITHKNGEKKRWKTEADYFYSKQSSTISYFTIYLYKNRLKYVNV